MTENNSEAQDRVLYALADLSGAVGKGFDRVHERFAEVGDRFNKVDRQLLEMRGQLDRIESMILRDHEERLHVIEEKLRLSKTR